MTKTFKFSFYFLLSLGFLAVFGVFAARGMEGYSDIFSIDAKIENEKEIDLKSDVKIIFNQPVLFFDSDNVNFNPAVEFEYELSKDKKELILKHKTSFRPETKYEINLNGARGFSGLLLENKRLIFYTASSLSGRGFGMPSGNKEKLFSEFELSKNKYIPPDSSMPQTDFQAEPKIMEGKYIDVSISNQIMTLFENGMRVNSFLVSSGVQGMSTPLGIFKIQKKEPNHWSSYGLWMPYSMNFYKYYYIHELPYWPNGYREGENSLGKRASHGCVRLGVEVAKYVYDWTEIGTPVYIHN